MISKTEKYEDILPPLTEDEKMQAGLCYPFWFIFAPFVLLGKKKDELFLYFHAIQGIYFGALTLVITLISSILVYFIFFHQSFKSVTIVNSSLNQNLMVEKLNFGLISVIVFGALCMFLLGVLFFSIWLGFKATSGIIFKLPYIGLKAYEKVEIRKNLIEESYIEQQEDEERDLSTSIKNRKPLVESYSQEELEDGLNPAISQLKNLFTDSEDEMEEEILETASFLEKSVPLEGGFSKDSGKTKEFEKSNDTMKTSKASLGFKMSKVDESNLSPLEKLAMFRKKHCQEKKEFSIGKPEVEKRLLKENTLEDVLSHEDLKHKEKISQQLDMLYSSPLPYSPVNLNNENQSKEDLLVHHSKKPYTASIVDMKLNQDINNDIVEETTKKEKTFIDKFRGRKPKKPLEQLIKERIGKNKDEVNSRLSDSSFLPSEEKLQNIRKKFEARHRVGTKRDDKSSENNRFSFSMERLSSQDGSESSRHTKSLSPEEKLVIMRQKFGQGPRHLKIDSLKGSQESESPYSKLSGFSENKKKMNMLKEKLMENGNSAENLKKVENRIPKQDSTSSTTVFSQKEKIQQWRKTFKDPQNTSNAFFRKSSGVSLKKNSPIRDKKVVEEKKKTKSDVLREVSKSKTGDSFEQNKKSSSNKVSNVRKPRTSKVKHVSPLEILSKIQKKRSIENPSIFDKDRKKKDNIIVEKMNTSPDSMEGISVKDKNQKGNFKRKSILKNRKPYRRSKIGPKSISRDFMSSGKTSNFEAKPTNFLSKDPFKDK